MSKDLNISNIFLSLPCNFWFTGYFSVVPILTFIPFKWLTNCIANFQLFTNLRGQHNMHGYNAVNNSPNEYRKLPFPPVKLHQ